MTDPLAIVALVMVLPIIMLAATVSGIRRQRDYDAAQWDRWGREQQRRHLPPNDPH